MNIHQTHTLSYKSRAVFQRMVVSHFERVPKEFVENEACFVFVNQGEVLVRTPDQFFHLPFAQPDQIQNGFLTHSLSQNKI